jgi:hypothetical protein
MSKNTEIQSKLLEASYRKKYGLRKSKRWICACIVIGSKKCMGRRSQDNCETPRQDHRSAYTDSEGNFVLIEQPYFGGLHDHYLEDGDFENAAREYDQDVASLTTDCEAFAKAWGLTVRLDLTESWHVPGKTILVEYRKAGSDA